MLISIIITAYNSKDYLIRALESIFIRDEKDIEVITIDNGSTEAIEGFIKSKYPGVMVIRNNKNTGTSCARNQGIRAARGDYLMFMDSDTELQPDFFSMLKKGLEKFPQNIASFSPKIIDKKTKKIFSCGLYVSPIYRSHDIGKGKPVGNFSYSLEIDGPNSCCAVFRREYLERVKEKSYFDENFFFLFEDTDLALRLKTKGCRSIFVPELICWHYGNSAGFSKEFRRFLCFRNRWYMILKIKQKKKLFLFLLKSFFYDFFRTLSFALTNRYFLRACKDTWHRAKKA